MENIERKNTFDEEWAARHKDEIERINAKAEKLRKNKRIQKIRKKFLKEKLEKQAKINYNQIQDELAEKKSVESVLNPIVIKSNSNQTYFKYKDINPINRLG